MTKTECKACGSHLGIIYLGDVLCKCGTYNIVRPSKETKVIHKDLYKPSSDLKYCAHTTYPMASSRVST